MQSGAYIYLCGKQRHCNKKRLVCWGVIGTKIGILAFDSYYGVVFWFHMQYLRLS